MDDTSRDLFLSPESLECHPPQMDSRWWGIYTLAFYPKISVWDKWTFFQSSAATSSGWWTLSLAFLSPSYDLSLIIVIYS
jgi:hypothetical protein